MRKFHLWFSLLLLGGLIAGSAYAPNNPLMWLASTSTTAQAMRVGLAALLLLQLVTVPPRHIALRLATGASALTACVAAIALLFSAQSPIVDVFALLQAGVALGIAALEYTPRETAVFVEKSIRPAAAAAR